MVAQLKLHFNQFGLDNRISRRSGVMLTANGMLLQGTISTYGQGCSLCDTNGSDIDLQRVRKREPAKRDDRTLDAMYSTVENVALGDGECIPAN